MEDKKPDTDSSAAAALALAEMGSLSRRQEVAASRVKAIMAARAAIALVLGVVFLGYILVWIMSSTNIFYLHWMPRVHAETNFTFIGAQGQNTLIFTLPVIFIAVMACLYLHLGKKLGHHHGTRARFAKWRKPALIKGALGIVSWTELTFLLMFIALLGWSVFSYLHAMFGPIRQEAAAQGLKVWEVKLSSSALTLGLVGNICLAFIFFPVTRGSSVLQMVGLTSESSIKYHMWLGHMAMTLFTLHGLCYIVFWFVTKRLDQMLKWDDLLVANLAGEVALAAGLVMWATSFNCIRRKFFELFFYTHHLYVLFVIFYVFHVGFSTACTILPGIYLFAVDRFLRLLQSQQRVRLVSARVLPCRAVELNFAKSSGLRYNPTSSMFINIPSISKLQWHPFSITSSSKLETDRVSVMIKSEGHWTTKLYQQLSSPSPNTHLKVSVEGPYGPASSEFMRYDTLVLVSGGSGITPFISIIREILCLSSTKGVKTPNVLLICAFKHSADLAILDLILPVPERGRTNETLEFSRAEFQIEAFVTREKERKAEEEEEQSRVRTLWFQPNETDTPMAAALGPNSWIWLGGIVSGSFVIYLVLIGLLTQYYIYPIDGNTNRRFSSPARAALNIMSVSVAIVVSSTIGFLWNRRGNRGENLRVLNRGRPMPAPSSRDGETEVESQHENAIQQATTVHLGKRPNMKRILLDVEGENVGVLASGPKKMRQRVANYCSSAMADNLHFHSISFTW